MPHSAKALRMEELDLCLYLSFSHIRLFVFVIETMYAYIPYLTPSFVMEVFLFFLGGRDLENYSRRHTREWKQDFGRGIIIFFLFLIFKGNIFWLP